jgi:hypothetical protein
MIYNEIMGTERTSENIFESRDLGIKSDLNADTFDVRCPYLGLKNDRATILGFPHVQNHCHRHDRPISVNLDTQSHLCLSDQFEGCTIFQQDPAGAQESDLENGKGNKANGTPSRASISNWAIGLRAWLVELPLSPSKARPLLFAIPVVLLIVAALVWWPAPGTSVEDNTSNAAPLNKVTTPSELSPAAGSQVDEVERENSQADTKSTTDAINNNQGQPETASQPEFAPADETNSDEAASQQSGSFRVLTYD